MEIPFFNSKYNRLKKLVKEGKFKEVQTIAMRNPKIIDKLLNFLRSNDHELLSNSIYIITKLYLKYNRNVGNLIPYIRKCLKSDDEDIVLNALISLKLILSEYPEYYEYTEDELWYVNRKFVTLQIREHVWDIIKKYGEGYKLEEEELHRAYERIRKLMRSPKQKSLIKKLLDVGKSLIGMFNKVKKLNITKDNLNSSLSKKELEERLNKNCYNMLKSGELADSNPLNIAQCLSKLPLMNKEEVNDVIEKVLEFLFSKNKIVRNIALNTVYNISKHYPDIIYNHYNYLIKYASLYGKSTTLELILKELSKKYDIERMF